MLEQVLFIVIPMAVGITFGYITGGLIRERLDAFIHARHEQAFLARMNFALLLALALSLLFVSAFTILIYSIGGTLEVIDFVPGEKSIFFSALQLVGYAMGFIGLPAGAGLMLAQFKGDWNRRQQERSEFSAVAARQ